MSVLPIETGRMVGANMFLLFLVSIEPYLYNLIPASYVSLPGQLDSQITAALYAIDMGSIFLIIAYFTHELTIEERREEKNHNLAETDYRFNNHAYPL